MWLKSKANWIWFRHETGDIEIFNEYLDKGIIEIEDSGFKGQGDVTLESNPLIAAIEMK